MKITLAFAGPLEEGSGLLMLDFALDLWEFNCRSEAAPK
jgi:hypothetical protein